MKKILKSIIIFMYNKSKFSIIKSLIIFKILLKKTNLDLAYLLYIIIKILKKPKNQDCLI